MITRDEADEIAERWVYENSAARRDLVPVVEEFDLGYVMWGQPPPGIDPEVGAGRGIIDRETGEFSVWPSLPIDLVIEEFRRRRTDNPPAARTWDPADELRRGLRRMTTPTNYTQLSLPDRIVTAYGVKSDAEPNLHRLVREFFANELPAAYRERGFDRCSEAAVMSDALHLEDARRVRAGEAPITAEQARRDVFGGGAITTYRVREPGDAVVNETAPPCVSCALLARHFGFEVRAPWESDNG